MPLIKTVIGSLPVYRTSDIQASIKAALDIQLRHDIDILSDGEQRTTMIEYFEQIPGFTKVKHSLHISGRIRPMDRPQDFVKVADYNFAKHYFEEKGCPNVKLKATVTGPVTLGFTSATFGLSYYNSIRDERIYMDAAEALRDVVHQLLGMHLYVQIDEPGITSGFMPPDVARRAIQALLRDVPERFIIEKKLSIHMCGPIPKALKDDILNFPSPVLSFAFSSDREKANLGRFTRTDLERNGKTLGVGCFTPTTLDVEAVDTAETVLRRLDDMEARFGEENISYAHPDCGLRNTPADVAEKILEKLNTAVNLYNERHT